MSNEQRPEPKRLGQWLVEQGTLREEQIQKLIELQARDARLGVASKIGELCVRTGWAGAGEVNAGLRKQKQQVIDHVGLGEVLIALDYLTAEKLDGALESRLDVFEPLDELMVDRGLCTPEEVRTAGQLTSLLRNSAAREQVNSTFTPFNIMELLVAEQIDDALREEGDCQCSQCWSNIFSVALNELPPRYVSEHGRILDCLGRFRVDYEHLVQEKLADAIAKVRANPKSACRSRFSDDLLSERGFQGAIHPTLVHVSNRHVHLSHEHIEQLFGAGYQLTKYKDLMQPGQFAAEETVSLLGSRGELPKVRVLGPARVQTQIEISGTDQFALGMQVPVRESGRLEGTPGMRLRGPAGDVEVECGCIRALRHVHMLPEEADRMGLQDGDRVSVRLAGDRATVCEGVLVRATLASALEMHIDTDEANAAGVPAESIGEILVSPANV